MEIDSNTAAKNAAFKAALREKAKAKEKAKETVGLFVVIVVGVVLVVAFFGGGSKSNNPPVVRLELVKEDWRYLPGGFKYDANAVEVDGQERSLDLWASGKDGSRGAIEVYVRCSTREISFDTSVVWSHGRAKTNLRTEHNWQPIAPGHIGEVIYRRVC